MLSPIIDRWLLASVAYHFDTTLTEHVHVDGEARFTDDKEKWYEIRMPRIRKVQRTKSYWDVFVQIDVACMSIDSNAYGVQDLTGKAYEAMTNTIKVYEYNKSGSHGELIGCLEREEDPRTMNFGEIKPDAKLYQSAVISNYRIGVSDG